MASSLLSEVSKYTVSDIALMGYSFILTRVFYPGASLIRRPISIRQKKQFHYGKGFTSGRNCRIEIYGNGTIELGPNCHIGDNVHIVASDRVQIGNDCLFASKIFISDTSHGDYGKDGSSPDVPPNERPLVSSPVSIGSNVWLGENVVVLSGVTIGSGCVVGANSVVTKSLPDNCIAVGAPAKPIKTYNSQTEMWELVQ